MKKQTEKHTASASAFAHSKSELAAALGVSRQLINAHKATGPKATADGRYSIADWRRHLAAFGRVATVQAVSRAGTAAPGAAEPDDLAAARLKGEQLSNWRKEFRNAVLQREYLPKAEVYRVCGQAIQSAKTRSFSGLPRLVALVRLAKDDEAALKAAREEQIAVWRAMESCDWFKPNERAN